DRGAAHVPLLMLDLDHFKQVNDLFGHAAGDRVLRRVGRCLRRLARATDSAGRLGGRGPLGGGESLVVLPPPPARGAGRLADRLREAIGRPPRDAAPPPVTTSVGV